MTDSVPPAMPAELVRFDVFEADLRTGELRRQGRNLRIPHQSFVVLASLLAHPGELVTREELRNRLWPPDVTVEYEQGLNAIVNRLREALGDSATKPRFVETLPRRGYRFIGRIDPPPGVTNAELVAPVSSVPQPDSSGENVVPKSRRWRGLAIVALVLCAGGLWVYVSSRQTSHASDSLAALASSRPRPITTFEGEEVAPALSADGTRVAFAWKRPADAGFDLYVSDLTLSAPLRLTRSPAQWISPTWSPDGSMIAFLRSSEADGGLFVVPALGGAERRLADAAVPTSLAQASWSHDGSRIAYAATNMSGASAIHLVSPTDLAIEALPSDPSCRDAGLPAFSPDGRSLAFVCATSVAVYQVRVMDVARRTTREVAAMLGYPQGLAWSSDGVSLVVANDAGDGGRLWRVPFHGAPALLPFGEDGSAPTISTGKGIVAYVRSRRDIDIRLVHLEALTNAEAVSQRVLVSSRVDMMPRLSPDGRLVAFQSNRSGSNEIWVGHLDGTGVTRITSFEGPLVGGPSWCQDSRQLAFDARASGTSAVYLATVGEGVPRRLETDVANLSLPAWSTDCKWIVASDGRDALHRISATGGAAVRLTSQPSYYAQIAGDRVVFNVKQPGGVQLWSQPIGGGEEAPLANMPLLRYDEPWALSNAGVYFVRVDAGRPSVQFYDWSHRTVHHVAWLRERPLPLGGLGLSVSGDGKTLLFAHEERVDSDVMVAEPLSPAR